MIIMKKLANVICSVSMAAAMAAAVPAYAADAPAVSDTTTPVFAAEDSATSEVKPLRVYVVEEDGTVNLVDTISPEERMLTRAAPTPITMNITQTWYSRNGVAIPNQANGSATLVTNGRVLSGDNCVGVYIYSSTLDKINVKIKWGTRSTYYYQKEINVDTDDAVVYFRAGRPADIGDSLVLSTQSTYSIVASTTDANGGRANIQIYTGTYTG